MAGVRILPDNLALDTLWGELVFTWARLHARQALQAQAEVFAELIAQTESEMPEQRARWRAEYEADALVDVADEGLDTLTDDILNDLEQADRKADSPRRPGYLGAITRGNLLRLALDSQLKRMTPWIAALSSEPEEVFQKHGKALKQVKGKGEDAIEARVKAETDRALHRARAIRSLFADANAARRDTYGFLVQYAAAQKLPNAWPERFFKKATRTTGSADSAPGEPVEG